MKSLKAEGLIWVELHLKLHHYFILVVPSSIIDSTRTVLQEGCSTKHFNELNKVKN